MFHMPASVTAAAEQRPGFSAIVSFQQPPWEAPQGGPDASTRPRSEPDWGFWPPTKRGGPPRKTPVPKSLPSRYMSPAYIARRYSFVPFARRLLTLKVDM